MNTLSPAYQMSASKLSWFLIAVSLLVSGAGAQVVPLRAASPTFAIFGEGSVNAFGSNPDPAQYASLYGGAAGVYLQTRPWLGVEARALFLQSASEPGHEEHQRAAFLGPRFEVARSRISLDGVLLGGASHVDYPASPVSGYPDGMDVLAASTRPALEAGGGLEIRLTPRLAWRTGDVMYGCVFGQNEPKGVTFSSGLSLRIFK
jgi:hypothetical protein